MATWRPVTAVALAEMGDLGRTYLLKVSSSNMQASCVISADVPMK